MGKSKGGQNQTFDYEDKTRKLGGLEHRSNPLLWCMWLVYLVDVLV